MYVFLLIGGLFLCAAGCNAYAASLGWMGEPKIKSIDSAPAICLPDDAKEGFPVYRVMVSESYVKNASYWELYIEPNTKPVILEPGGCIRFGEILKGYKLEGDLTPATLRSNFTYSFTMDRVRDAKHYNYFYSAAFCVMAESKESWRYPQYTRLPDSGEVIPSCDARRNGNVQLD